MSAIVPMEWQARLRARIYAQYARSNWAVPLANAVGVGTNRIEAAALALMYLFSIDPITDDASDVGYGIGRGLQLDRIGRLVGQPRGAADDATYRPILRARIAANRSWGSGDNVIGVFLSMFAGAGAPLVIRGWIAEFTVRLVGVVMPPLLVPSALALLRTATQAGQRAVLEWTTVAPRAVLTCNSLEPGQSIGDATNPAVGGALGGAQAAT